LVVIISVLVGARFVRSFGSKKLSVISFNSPSKQVILVRQDLKMGAGKIAAQCAHAAVKAYKDLSSGSKSGLLKSWEASGQAKLVLKVPDEPSLLDLADRAKKRGLHVSCIRDAGRTQVEPNTLTVCAIGPGKIEDIDEITGHLKLL
jgi:peptidyl-tRNA hydrolase, PTH2 family